MGGGGDTVLVSNAGTLTLAGNVTNSYRWSNRSLRLAGSGNGVISGIISDGVYVTSVTKSGTGTWTLSGANTYGGVTAINSSVLNIQNSLAFGSSGSQIIVKNGATLQILGGITVNRPLQLSGMGYADQGALNSISGDNTWSGDITFGNDVRQEGYDYTLKTYIASQSGTLTLSSVRPTLFGLHLYYATGHASLTIIDNGRILQDQGGFYYNNLIDAVV